MKALLFLLLSPALLFAQATPTVKQAPPPGIPAPEADAALLKLQLVVLDENAKALSRLAKGKPEALALLPDVEVFLKAVRYALQYNEFFNPREIAAAKLQLTLAAERANELAEGKPTANGTHDPMIPGPHWEKERWTYQPTWASATGPLVLGYRSRIDESVQPYGLIVPDDWKPGDKTPRALWLWFHGRGDTLSEVNFIAGRLKGKRDFAPAGAFELHLYGRYCNASKFAGEVDAFEALADVQRRYAIDPQRIAVAGFSMGGATSWHLGAHHAGLWALVAPGAGFAETQQYAKVYDPKKAAPPWWEEVLYRLYNATDVAANFSNVPLVVYSGADDPQKQAADIMEAALANEGMKMEHFIGPNTGHKYEPETKKALAVRLQEIVARGREPMAPRVRFQTCTLRYHQMKWITLDALERHWTRAELDAELVDEGTFQIKTQNIAGFTIALPPGPAPLDKTHPPRVVIDGQELVGPAVREDWRASFEKTGGKWRLAHRAGPTNITGDFPPLNPAEALDLQRRSQDAEAADRGRKRHGVQGPIDDAFMDTFIFVRPTGKPLNAQVGAWAQSELERAIVEWRKVFRGDVQVKNDRDITPMDMERANLILWGDPGSNSIIASLLPKLPIQWTKDQLTMGAQRAGAADHAPILIQPNPFNPDRYVVLNSGFTFRMGAKTSNSLQTPKLPDWALIDLRTPPDDHWPGHVVDAGFFDESWQWPKK